MAHFTLTERPDPDLVYQVARHKKLHNPHREQLEAFGRCVDKKKGLPIKYEQRHIDDVGDGFGRYYPVPSRMSAIYQWNAVRSTLYGQNETDIDIVACQPSILYGYCKQLDTRGILDEDDYESLKDLIENRDKIIDDFILDDKAITRWNDENDDNKTKKDLVKNLIVMLQFGSNIKMWADKWELSKDEYKRSRWVKNYSDDMKLVSKLVVDNHPKKEIAVRIYREKQFQKEKLTNKKAKLEDIGINHQKVLALLLQDKEAEIVRSAITKMKANGLDVRSYIYDGFQVANDERITDELLDSIGCPEFYCRFIRKPFNEALPMGQEYLNPEPPKYFRSTLLNSIGKHSPLHPTPKETLRERQKYFEEFFAVMEGTQKIMEQNGDRIYYHSYSNRKTRWGDCKYIAESAMGIHPADFVEWWLEQDTRRTYRSVETRPPPLKTAPNVLNLWDGWSIEKIPYDDSVDIQQIMKLMRSVAGDNDSFEYLLKWFAHKVQFPGKKTEVALVFYSATEGTGKTSVAEGIMSAFLGDEREKLMMSTDTIDAVCGKFANAGERLWVVLNEANLGDIVGKSNPLKTFITDRTFLRERKGVDAEMADNIAEMIFTTNNANAVKISPTDRRFMIFEADATNANDPEYFKPIHKALEDPKVMRSVFEFFKTKDITGFHPSTQRVRSNIYKEFLQNSLSTIQRFWIHYFDEIMDETDKTDETDVWRASYEWYEDYKLYCMVQGRNSNVVPTNIFTRQSVSSLGGIKAVKGMVEDDDGKKKQVRGLKICGKVLGGWCERMRVKDDDE